MSTTHPEHLSDQPHRPASTFARLVYTVFWLNVLALMIFIIGLFAGWFWPEAELVRDGAYRVSVVVNTREARQDMSEVAEATRNIAETGKSAAEMDTIQGKITDIDLGSESLTVKNPDHEATARVTEATEFDVEGKGQLSELTLGDEVRITMRQKGDHYYAFRITAVAE